MTEQLANAIILSSIPEYIRSDNGPEFIAKELLSWLSGIGVKTAYIEPGSPCPWKNGFCENFITVPLEITFWMGGSSIA